MTRSWSALVLSLLVLACGGGEGGDPVAPDDPVTPPPPEEPSKPTSLPALGSLGLFTEASPFNTPLPADPALHPSSAELAAAFAVEADRGLVLTWRQYSAPVFLADASTPRVDVALECGSLWELGVTHMTGVPVPPWAEPAHDADGADAPPVGCGEESDQDNHMVVLDPLTRCEYDFWQARKQPDGSWSASWGNALSLDSDGIYPGALSTRASGFPFLGGVVWPDELRDGRIEHVLAFNFPWTRTGGPVAPATDSDGVTPGDDALPMGLRLRLDPDLDLDALGLQPWVRTLARAMQEYGLLLVDTGGEGAVGLYAVDPRSVEGDPYGGVLPDEDWPLLEGIPTDRFQVLESGPQDPDWMDHVALAQGGCATFR